MIARIKRKAEFNPPARHWHSAARCRSRMPAPTTVTRPLRELELCVTSGLNMQVRSPKRERWTERRTLAHQESFHTRRESVGLIGEQCVPRIFDALDSALRHRLLEPFCQFR